MKSQSRCVPRCPCEEPKLSSGGSCHRPDAALTLSDRDSCIQLQSRDLNQQPLQSFKLAVAFVKSLENLSLTGNTKPRWLGQIPAKETEAGAASCESEQWEGSWHCNAGAREERCL